MMILTIVEQEFDDFTKEFFKNNEALKTFVLNHPNKHKLISNITQELKIAELKVPYLVNRDVIRKTTQSFVKMFAKAALHEKEKEIVSQQALYQQKLEQDKIKFAEERLQDADIASVETFMR